MSSFIVVAVLLTLVAIGALIYPLLRRHAAVPSALPMAAMVGVLVAGGGAVLYPVWSNWKWSEPAPAADSPAAMVGRLARRLEKEPNDLEGWLMLGRSYAILEQYPLATRAYQRADTLAQGKNAEALLGLGDALVNGGRSDLAGRAGKLFERALELDPNSVKALFYSAVAAFERSELPLARTRFTRLLEGNPPPEVRRIIEEQVSAIDGMMLMAANASSATPRSGGASGAAAVSQQSAAPAPVSAAVTVPLRITLAPGVAARANAGAPLFVLARIPGQRGPPLAAKRLEARFPQDVSLASTDAMIAGSGFAAGQEIEIEARIANGGSAISSSGDPFGVMRIKAGAAQRTNLEINQLKP
jgi:cytochrome c-type biogenesis protein CcmH